MVSPAADDPTASRSDRRTATRTARRSGRRVPPTRVAAAVLVLLAAGSLLLLGAEGFLVAGPSGDPGPQLWLPTALCVAAAYVGLLGLGVLVGSRAAVVATSVVFAVPAVIAVRWGLRWWEPVPPALAVEVLLWWAASPVRRRTRRLDL